MKQSGYQGAVYLVNPKYEEIEGYLCYPDIESLPVDIDMAIISIKSSEVLPALERLAKRSIKSAVVFSSGFSEAGEKGIGVQKRLTTGGTRIIMTDKCENYGIELAELLPDTVSKLKEILPPFASVKNPCDVIA